MGVVVGVKAVVENDILRNAPFRSQIFKIFFASGGKGSLTPRPKSCGRPWPRVQQLLGIDAGQVRYWSLTSLNITQTISDKQRRIRHVANMGVIHVAP